MGKRMPVHALDWVILGKGKLEGVLEVGSPGKETLKEQKDGKPTSWQPLCDWTAGPSLLFLPICASPAGSGHYRQDWSLGWRGEKKGSWSSPDGFHHLTAEQASPDRTEKRDVKRNSLVVTLSPCKSLQSLSSPREQYPASLGRLPFIHCLCCPWALGWRPEEGKVS